MAKKKMKLPKVSKELQQRVEWQGTAGPLMDGAKGIEKATDIVVDFSQRWLRKK